jgi:arylsulfatase A-like enzyme
MGVAENTLVFFVGDNGSDAPLGHEHAVSSSAPLRGKKGSHYEGGMRVPFIAAWARPNPDSEHQQRVPVAAGTINSQLAAVYDLFPTVLAAADVRVPGDQTIDGSTLEQMLNGRHDPSRSPSFLMHYPHAHRSNYFTSFRDGDWKVIYHYFPSPASGGSHYQLYNLANDPFEQTDLAQAQPEHLSRMIGGMIESLQRHDALYPVSESADRQPLKPKLPQLQPPS